MSKGYALLVLIALMALATTLVIGENNTDWNDLLIDQTSDDLIIHCHACHYTAYHNDIFPAGMEYNWRGMDRYMKEVCAADDSNLLMCGKKVKNCVTTVSSESYRASREDTDHTEVAYVVSHYCGSRNDTKRGCKYYEGRTQGPSVTCICGGTACNRGYNDAVTLQPSLTAMGALTAAAVLHSLLSGI